MELDLSIPAAEFKDFCNSQIQMVRSLIWTSSMMWLILYHWRIKFSTKTTELLTSPLCSPQSHRTFTMFWGGRWKGILGALLLLLVQKHFWDILPAFPLSRIWALVQSSSKYWGTWTLTRFPQPRQSFSALGSLCMTLKHWSKSRNQKIHLFLQLSNCSHSQKSNWKVSLKMGTKMHRSFGFNSKISMEVPSTLSSPGSTEFWRTLVSSKKLSM